MMIPNINKNIFFLLLLTVFSLQAKNSDRPLSYSGLPSQSYQKISIPVFNKNSDQMSFTGFNKSSHSYDIVQKNKLNNGDSYIQAQTKNSKTWINATIGKNSIFGEMHDQNKHYIITTDANGSWLIELPENGFSYNSCGVDHEQSKQAKAPLSLINAKQKDIANKSASSVIDIYMIYDQDMVDRYPGDLLETRLNQYFNVANQSLFNSNIDLSVRLVGFEKTTYSSTNSNIDARNDMYFALSGSTINGLTNLKQRREELGADMVVLIRPHDIEARGNCGIAFFPYSENDDNTFDESFGVHVMSDGMSSWSICTDQLMIHELGHNLGATHHNDPNSYLPGGGGYAKLGKFTTIMGSFGTGQPERFFEIDTFSNPSIQCAGVPCGIADQFDNANVVSQLAPIVAGYQSSVSNLPLSDINSRSNLDSDGDGVNDWDDQFPFDKNETSDQDDDGVGDNSDVFPTDSSEQIDTDGDGTGNNADDNDDGDSADDSSDYFPLDANEIADSDQDGIGDNADAFPNNLFEQVDNDNDAIGDNQDQDDDNDGFNDVADLAQDLLVINTGNNQILRFDAQTGQSAGIELKADDGVLTFQSDLTYRSGEQILFYTSSSSVKRLDLSSRNPLGEAIPAYAKTDFQETNYIQLFSGFPTSLVNLEDSSEIIVTKLDSQGAIAYKGSFPTVVDLENGNTVYVSSSFEDTNDDGTTVIINDTQNLIDTIYDGSDLYFLGQTSHLYKGPVTDFSINRLGDALHTWMDNPYALVKTDDDRLLISNQDSHEIGIVNANSGDFMGILIDISDHGYSNPTGMAVTNDNVLLVAAKDQNAILKIDISSGEFLGTLVVNTGLNSPHKMILVPKLVDRFHNDDEKVIRPNAGLWYNPETSGRGFDIQVFNSRLSAIWYTFDEAGLPIWYISSGDLNEFNYTGDFLKTHQNPDGSVSTTVVGNISIDFSDERNAQINWQINNSQDSETIEWLSFSHDAELENYTGLWGRTDGPGWGVSVATNGPISVAIPYIYDSSGEPRWLISDPVNTQSPLNFSLNAVYSDTLCPSCSGVSSSTIQSSGTMTLNLSEDKSWDSNILFNTPLNGDWILDNTELKLFSSPATRPR